MSTNFTYPNSVRTHDDPTAMDQRPLQYPQIQHPTSATRRTQKQIPRAESLAGSRTDDAQVLREVADDHADADRAREERGGEGGRLAALRRVHSGTSGVARALMPADGCLVCLLDPETPPI